VTVPGRRLGEVEDHERAVDRFVPTQRGALVAGPVGFVLVVEIGHDQVVLGPEVLVQARAGDTGLG